MGWYTLFWFSSKLHGRIENWTGSWSDVMLHWLCVNSHLNEILQYSSCEWHIFKWLDFSVVRKQDWLLPLLFNYFSLFNYNGCYQAYVLQFKWQTVFEREHMSLTSLELYIWHIVICCHSFKISLFIKYENNLGI